MSERDNAAALGADAGTSNGPDGRWLASDLPSAPYNYEPLLLPGFQIRLTAGQRLRQRFTWRYLRQTRLLYPLTMWWLNRA